MESDLTSLTQALRDFAQARNWEQFHSPKNLASALSVEAAELLEHFQWLTEAQSRSLPADKRAPRSAPRSPTSSSTCSSSPTSSAST